MVVGPQDLTGQIKRAANQHAHWLTVGRKPLRGLGIPPKVRMPWPRSLIAAAAAMCLLLPIFGLSVLIVLGIDRLARRQWRLA